MGVKERFDHPSRVNEALTRFAVVRRAEHGGLVLASTTIHVYPSVTITGDIGIPVGGSTDYQVGLSASSAAGPIVLSLALRVTRPGAIP
jgi:hypothetical protein